MERGTLLQQFSMDVTKGQRVTVVGLLAYPAHFNAEDNGKVVLTEHENCVSLTFEYDNQPTVREGDVLSHSLDIEEPGA